MPKAASPIPKGFHTITPQLTLDNAAAWITAGAVAVGIGTALVSKSAVDQGRFDEISRHARTLIESIRTARAASTGVRR